MKIVKNTLTEDKIKEISTYKREPDWMMDFRIQAFHKFEELQNPNFGPPLEIDFDLFTYYKTMMNKQESTWKNVEENIRKTFDHLGLIEAEKKYLGGVGAQFESEVVYHNMLEELKEKNVIFCDTDTALKKYPDLFQKYFNHLVSYDENK